MAQQIPKDTKFFTYYNINPKNRHTGDCVTRAISTALKQDYNTTILELAQLQADTGYTLDEPNCYSKYLKMKGWVKCKQPHFPNGKRVKGKEFFIIKSKIPCILHIGSHHLSCIIDGRIHDIWDCSDEYVGNFWIPYEYKKYIME